MPLFAQDSLVSFLSGLLLGAWAGYRLRLDYLHPPSQTFSLLWALHQDRAQQLDQEIALMTRVRDQD
jgi:hypothetical protein